MAAMNRKYTMYLNDVMIIATIGPNVGEIRKNLISWTHISMVVKQPILKVEEKELCYTFASELFACAYTKSRQ